MTWSRVGAWALAAGMAIVFSCNLAQAQTSADVGPRLLPIEQSDAATVGARLFNRRGLSVMDGQGVGQVIVRLAKGSGVVSSRAVVTAAVTSDAASDWHEARPEELLAMDPLTVSVVDLPMSWATGAALLAGLGAVAYVKRMRAGIAGVR
jgi:hypothetical protein